MPVLTQIPASVGSPAQWTAVGTGDPGCVQGNDGDTTYLTTSTQNYAHVHYCTPAIPSGAVDPVNSCSATWVCKSGGSDTAGIYYGSELSDISSSALTGSYAPYGGSWPSLALAGIDGVGTKIRSGGSGTVDARVTYIYRTVDYTLAGGGMFVFFSVLTPLIGSGLTWMQFRQAVAFALCHTRFRADELVQFWREWVAYRHPCYIVLGR